MKSLLVSCLLCISFSATSQNLVDLVQQALDYYQKQDYENAIPAAEKAGNEILRWLGEDSLFYPGMLKIQAESYYNTFRYKNAESCYLRLCDNVTKFKGENSDAFTACLNNLATVYEAMGQYDKSEALLIRARDIMRRTNGENSLEYSIGVNNLAGLYHTMGLYQKAEPLYNLAISIRKRSPGENSAEYANSLNNLAAMYTEMGLYEMAETLFGQARDIRKKVLGENNADYAASLNNVGFIREELEDYTQAEQLYIQAMNIRKRILGENHPDYAASLNNLAGVYIKQGQYQKSEPLLEQAREIWKRRLGENHPDYAKSLNNLAALYRRWGMYYNKAETYYKQALDIRKRVLGENHPICADTENDLALLYSQMGQEARARPLFLSSSRKVMQNLLGYFPILSEKEKSNYINYNIVFTDCNNSFLYKYSRDNSSICSNNMNLQLFFKSLALADTRNMIEAVRNSKDNSLKKLFSDWQANKILLARQYSLAAGSRMQNLRQVEAETEAQEKELNRRSAEFRQQQSALQVSISDVWKSLEPEEAAIEFVSFRLYRGKQTDSVMYAAYILTKKDSVPVFVPLFEEKQLQKIFESAGKTATGMVSKFYRGAGLINKNASFLGDSLYRLVWQPLEPFLKGIKRIAYSPAGKLFSVALHALPADSTSLLMDKYEIQQYSSTRQLAIQKNNESVRPAGIALFGDADFNMDSTDLVRRRSGEKSFVVPGSVFGPGSRGGSLVVWPALPGTADEVKKIHDLFDQNKISSRTFTQANASEENLKALSGNAPQVLHIATHGFFLPEPDKKRREQGLAQGNTYSLADDPLLRSGLILSGGNYAWSGKRPIEGVEDGIATAYEISQLNLSNTELVVLSACETALGDIKGSEGVFGLQRAFKMAGVKKMIVSLWQVPDKETAELMTTFYSNWLKGKTIEDAFAFAQAEMRKKYSPFYWAAFVLVE